MLWIPLLSYKLSYKLRTRRAKAAQVLGGEEKAGGRSPVPSQPRPGCLLPALFSLSQPEKISSYKLGLEAWEFMGDSILVGSPEHSWDRDSWAIEGVLPGEGEWEDRAGENVSKDEVPGGD